MATPALGLTYGAGRALRPGLLGAYVVVAAATLLLADWGGWLPAALG